MADKNDIFFCKPSQNKTNTKSVGVKKVENKGEKKPFDKKKYRQQKYSVRAKIDKWEEQRKRKVLRQYYKEQKQEKNVKKVENEKPKGLTKAQIQFNQVQEEKKRQKEEFARRKQEQEDALQNYKRKKLEKHKKLSKKTRKGQPVMKGRLEYLLEKIQQNYI